VGVATARSGPLLDKVKLSDFDETATADDEFQTIPVAVKLLFDFFPGRGREPTTTEIDSLVDETKLFFRDKFQKDPAFTDAFQDFDMAEITPLYNGIETPDAFTLEFIAKVILDKTATHTQESQVLAAMGASNFREYIGQYVRQTTPNNWNEFYQTHSVHFTGVGHG
jgi:hypothetical protein